MAVKGVIGLAIFAVVAILLNIIVLVIILTVQTALVWKISEPNRVECPGLRDDNCEAKMCVYQKVKNGPSCFMKENSFGYRMESVSYEPDGPRIQLTAFRLETPYGDSIENVTFKLTYITENIVRFQFKDSDKKRFEVPVQNQFPLLNNPKVPSESNLTYEFVFSKSTDAFNFGIKRTDESRKMLWDTRIGALMMSDKFLQIGSYLPSRYVYGLGEHERDRFRHDLNYVTWPMFSRRQNPEQSKEKKNLAGVHPFYTCLEETGKSHAVLFLNSNAMEVTFLPAPAVTFRTIGGILDFFMFIGENPEHVIRLYTSLVGRPTIPPYWSLGFQLARFGYGHESRLKGLVDRNLAAQIPLRVVHLSMDSTHKGRDLTYDNGSFPSLPTLVKEYQGKKVRWALVLDSGIPAAEDFEMYTSGRSQSVFVKRSAQWPSSIFPKELQNFNITFGTTLTKNYVAYPDFFSNATILWWKDQLKKFNAIIKYDGVTLISNEPYNWQLTDEEKRKCVIRQGEKKCWFLQCPDDEYENPVYNPLKKAGSDKINDNTLCMGSIHGDTTFYLHYDVHSLYGWSQTKPTYETARESSSLKPLVMSKSTYPSSGQHGGHWFGENYSTYEDMKKSIIGMLEFNLFGIPYVGADVCGFIGDASPELCKRWTQLGAFYPFFRNHNDLEYRDQDPASYAPPITKACYTAMERREKLNLYLYTLFYYVHMNGGTVVRPLFHEFPMDNLTYGIDGQFMWGSSLLVSPILEQGHYSVPFYLPHDEWWSFRESESYMEWSSGHYLLAIDVDTLTPLHVRGGTVLPYGILDRSLRMDCVNKKCDPMKYPIDNSFPLELYVFPKNGKAEGELFIDDGISYDTILVPMPSYAFYRFSLENCTLTLAPNEKTRFKGPFPVLMTVYIFKVKEVLGVTSNVGNLNFTFSEEHNCVSITFDNQLQQADRIIWSGANQACMMLD